MRLFYPLPLRRLVAGALSFALLPGGLFFMVHSGNAADEIAGPRSAAWQRVDKALEEGKPKSALEALGGIEQSAVADKAWAEAARAIATRILAETGDRPDEDPERLVRLAAAIPAAPAETQAVLKAIQANWTWGFFQSNRWRFAQRTPGAIPAKQADLAGIASWDLPRVVAEIRARFAAALANPAATQKLPVAEWSPLLTAGTMSDAYRPTLWDVLVHDALAFAATGERGLADPEDLFELSPESPALGTPGEFCAWNPAADPTVTDTDSTLLEALKLHQDLLRAHAADTDRTAFLAADLDRILWAAEALPAGDSATAQRDRKAVALEAFLARADNHEMAALARSHLANLERSEGDAEALVRAHALATAAVAAHPASAGGRLCKNLLAEIEAKSLTLETERTWSEPWPVIRVSYANLAKVHLRIVAADWLARARAGKPQEEWLDEADRQALLKQPPLRAFSVDMPATPDYQPRSHDIPVPQDLPPGSYWVLASHTPDFGAQDNVVSAGLVWVSRLALVAKSGGNRPAEPLSGHVVDIFTGEPLAGATVDLLVREPQGNPPRFVEKAQAQTDAEGRYELPAEPDREMLLVASATLAGAQHSIAGETLRIWRQQEQTGANHLVLVTDRGIYRPGQTLFYKGIYCHTEAARQEYAALEGQPVVAVLRDANGRELARLPHTTTSNGSFQGSFSIPSGALPGQWALVAEGEGASQAVGVQVEEYRRPKFLVDLAAPTAEVLLGKEVSLSGTATTYTGLPVAGAKVRWHVERMVRFPDWCRWFFPDLPFGSPPARIARGTATSDANGLFTVSFPARPDNSLPRESLPVFTYRVVADVTDPAGETRSAEQPVQAGYVALEATLAADDWQAVGPANAPATVPLTISTRSLDGQPRWATGTLTIKRLVQPATMKRSDFFDPVPRPLPSVGRRGGRIRPGRPLPPPALDPHDPHSWDAGEVVATLPVTTDAATGKLILEPQLPAGIYRAELEIPAGGDALAVKARHTIEVLDPAAASYAVKRPFALREKSAIAPAGSTFEAVLGTGFDSGRALVEFLQDGKTLKRFWTEPGRTQWPVSLPVGEEQRGGFTLRAWLVRDGRLQSVERTIDVPWTNKQFAVSWERFRRRVEPGTQEVWRAKVMSVADPLAGPAAPAVAEMVATLYDQSLDALTPHTWPNGISGLLRREFSGGQPSFTNSPQGLQQIGGSWRQAYEPVEITYRQFREPFGAGGGQGWGMRRKGMLTMGRAARSNFAMPMAAAPEMMMVEKAAVVADEAAPNVATSERGNGAGSGSAVAVAAAPAPRRNLVETAFFFPTVSAGPDGILTLEFTLPDTLTTWQFKGLVHDARLRSGTLLDQCVSAKDLMVEPLPPRFVREGDLVEFPVKVSNRSTGRLMGTVRLTLSDAQTNTSRDALLEGPREQAFDLAAGESKAVSFPLRVAAGTETLKYLATGSAGRASDGEEAFLPVLSKRVLVSESVPITLRGPGAKTVVLKRLAQTAETPAIESQSLVVQAASNPAWYGVLALPALVEKADESVETLFTRLYANTLARHIAEANPRIAEVLAQWQGTEAFHSPLEKNTAVLTTLLAETPWVREAVDEREARQRITLLLDRNRAEREQAEGVARLESLRTADGGWPWFPGGGTCDQVTLSILSGFGRLRAAGAKVEMQPALATLPWLDARLARWKAEAAKLAGEPSLSPTVALALYARSFCLADAPLQGEAGETHRWWLAVAKKSWPKLAARRSQGETAIALVRSGEREVALSIIDSLRQRAVGGGEPAAIEEENSQGMWWRDPHPAWWNWAGSPIETQAVMIEAFDEVAGDRRAVEELKIWLLSQKRTSRWPGNRATANAVGALLGRGDDLLGSRALVAIDIGGETVGPGTEGSGRPEPGTGFIEARFVRREIVPAMASVTLTKTDAGPAWGGIHWQYLDDIANVPAIGRSELAIEKQLFVKRMTAQGPVLVPVPAEAALPAKEGVQVGDELVVRLKVTSDRDYEFLELSDHRPSLTEPVDVLSGWRYADGVGWYAAVRDASMQLFFERLPRGTHIFEYSLRASHAGQASSGFATLQSRYCPEFSAHSASIQLDVRK